MIVKTYALSIDRNGTLRGICGQGVDSMMTQEAAGAELDRRVRRYAAEHGQDLRTHYSSILHRIIEGASDELKEAYAGARVRPKAAPTSPADEVHARASDYMREHEEVDYTAALREVLDAAPDLRDAYALGEWPR
jgi:hypothetical protein